MSKKLDNAEDFGSSDCYVAICAACGYQWNETKESTFELECPSCTANMVHKAAFNKPEVMGDDYDGMPWF